MFTNLSPQQTIDKLRDVYVSDNFQFDFNVSMYIAGDGNKYLRQSIIKILTGQELPASKCGMYACSDALKQNFEQLTIQFN